MRLFLLIFLISVTPAYAIEPVAKVIEQPDSPLKITDYKAEYKKRGAFTGDIQEGIYQNVEYQNTGDKVIVAVRITFISFSVFNEFLDRTYGIEIDDMPAGKTGKGTWIARSLADFSFLTGLVYVDAIRFGDGTIWKADMETIGQELQKIEADLDLSKLSEEEWTRAE